MLHAPGTQADLDGEDQRENKMFKIKIFMPFRYGVVLKKLDLRDDALEVMQEAVNKEPLHWGAWLELSSLCTDKEIVSRFNLCKL